jgi:4-amino-4-deoxy-L-arabinose transferase-like glycosyltransferase
LVLLFAGSLCIRMTVGSFQGLHEKVDSDESEYYNAAVSLAQGNGYRLVAQQTPDGAPRLTAYRMPGPALILAIVFKLFGTTIAAARLASIVVGALAAPLMYLLARNFTTFSAAVLSGVACSLHPVWNFIAPAILSEPYFIPSLLLSLSLSARAFKTGAYFAFCAGLAWGATTLVRPQGLPVAILIGLLAICQGRWRISAALALGTVLMLAPWVIRNYLVFHRLEILATEGGETFLGSNNKYVLSDPSLHGMWLAPMRVPEYRNRLAGVHDDFERSRTQNAIARQFLKENPAALPKLAIFKLWRWLTPVAGSRGAVRLLILCSYGLLVLALAIGLAIGVFKPTIELKLALICTICFAVTTAIYWGNLTRGRMPLEMIWIPWGASAVCDLFSRRSETACILPSA